MFPLADTLCLPVFPQLRFQRNRTTFLYVSVKVNRCFRKRKCVESLRKHAKTFRKPSFGSVLVGPQVSALALTSSNVSCSVLGLTSSSVSARLSKSQFHVSVNVIGCNYCGNTSLRVGNRCFQVISIKKKRFHYLGVVFPPSIVTKTHSLHIFMTQNNTKATFPSTFFILLAS